MHLSSIDLISAEMRQNVVYWINTSHSMAYMGKPGTQRLKNVKPLILLSMWKAFNSGHFKYLPSGRHKIQRTLNNYSVWNIGNNLLSTKQMVLPLTPTLPESCILEHTECILTIWQLIRKGHIPLNLNRNKKHKMGTQPFDEHKFEFQSADLSCALWNRTVLAVPVCAVFEGDKESLTE